MQVRAALSIRGIVQGVGFRPYIYRLAGACGVTGFVRNTPFGVQCEVQGERETVLAFIEDVPLYAPHAAHIEKLAYEFIELGCESDFRILPTVARGTDTVISPDLAICEKCKQELFDPADRRYLYPFINCTACGPRYSIISSMPYDRCRTSMSGFELCEDCRSEYEEPVNRRFHAEPNACAVCGPQLRLLDKNGKELEGDWLKRSVSLLREGYILAIKGIGGFHLAADAANEAAVSELRRRKHRDNKPFAVMMRDFDTVREYCELDAAEEQALCSKVAPIVILDKRDGKSLAASVAPQKSTLGVFLPYTALHCLLMREIPTLVMTSANFNEEPIIYKNEAALSELNEVADAFLLHDRDILHPCDDSVLEFADGRQQLIRRSRGFAPAALPLNCCNTELLAVGGEQKNAFALCRDGKAFLSAHMGELADFDAYRRFENEIASLQDMLEIRPRYVVCDMHPDYESSRFADMTGLQKIEIQHHHAHFAGVLAENEYSDNALGVIFDGTGYGTDGVLWGSEILLGDIAHSKRCAHLLPFALPGGERAVKEPWRVAYSLLAQSLTWAELAHELQNLPETAHMLQNITGQPLACGMGRLFDGVSALLGICQYAGHEGQAAELLEEAARRAGGRLEINLAFDIIEAENGELLLDWRRLIYDIVKARQEGAAVADIALAFHKAICLASLEVCRRISAEQGCKTVAFSGGCFQNRLLMREMCTLFRENGFVILLNINIPCNDGGLCFGQAASASMLLKEERNYVSGNSRQGHRD